MAYKNDVTKMRYVLAYGVAKERFKAVGRVIVAGGVQRQCVPTEGAVPFALGIGEERPRAIGVLKLPVLLLNKTNRALCYPIRLCLAQPRQRSRPRCYHCRDRRRLVSPERLARAQSRRAQKV
jgi:hypothetical protein